MSPTPGVPGAPMMSQSSGAYSAGNPATPEQPPYGRYHPRENDVVSPVPSAPGDTLPDTLPTVPSIDMTPAPVMEKPVDPPPVEPTQAGLLTPVAFVPAPTPGEDDMEDSVSAVEMPPPSNPYWKFPVSTRFVYGSNFDHNDFLRYIRILEGGSGNLFF